MMELVQQLKQDGIAKGLCQPWQKKLKDGVSMKRLIDLYIRGIDFCVKNNYPTLEFIREHFNSCEEYGVYVDNKHLNEMNIPDAVLHGECKGTLSYNGYSVCRAYIRHDSSVTVAVYGNAHLTVDVFDNSKMLLYAVGSSARVLVNVYGDAQVDCTGFGVKVIYKHKKTY